MIKKGLAQQKVLSGTYYPPISDSILTIPRPVYIIIIVLGAVSDVWQKAHQSERRFTRTGAVTMNRKITHAAAAALITASMLTLSSCSFIDDFLASGLSGIFRHAEDTKITEMEEVEIRLYVDEGAKAYKVEKNGSGVTVSYYRGLWEFSDDIDREDCLEQRVEGGEDLYKRILDKANSCKMKSWDGFSETNDSVVDGSSFNFSATLDGKDIRAHGSNAYPDGFRDFRDEIIKILDEAKKTGGDNMKASDFESIIIDINGSEAATQEYEILRTADGVRISYYYGPWMYSDDEPKEDWLEDRVEGGRDLLDEVLILINDCKVKKWDGFSKSASGVLDGESFSFEAVIDGSRLTAHGSNSFPGGFNDFINNLWKILKDK